MFLMCTDISEESLILMIDAIVSKLSIDIRNSKKLNLICAIKQLSVNPNSSGESLSKDYLTLISNEDKLKQEVSQRPSRMQRLRGMDIKENDYIYSVIIIHFNLFSAIMLALFDNWHTLRGLNVKPNSREDLQEALQTSNTLDSLISMFEF